MTPRPKKTPTGKTPAAARSPAPGSAGRPAGLSDRWLVFGICLFLAAIVWLVFGQTVHFAFVGYDDNTYVYENPAITRGLSLNGVEWAFTHVVVSNWHPLTMLSHMLDCQLYGLNAGGHHLTNVLLHTASVILLFLVLRRMTGKLWRSAMVAAVFGIHPLRAESVAWVAERKDVLSGLFFMFTLWAYVRYTRRPFSLGRYLWVAILFALGLLCKPMLVTLPFVLLLLDYWPLGRFQLTNLRATLRALWPLFREKIPFFVLAAVLSVVGFLAQSDARIALEHLSTARRSANMIVSYGSYMWEMVWPRNLGAHYPFVPAVPIWQIVSVGALLLTFTVLAIQVARRNAYILVGWLWYLGMLVPVIGLVQVGSQSHADRYTYLPQIGLYLLLTWAAADVCARWRYRHVMLGGASTMILIALIFCARAQASYWQNSESLWTHTLASSSNNLFAYDNLGRALYDLGRKEEAMVHFRQALQIDPRYAPAQDDLGLALFQMGQKDEAIIQLRQASQINPQDAKIHDHLGNALLSLGRMDEAIIQFRQALHTNPKDADAENDLGFALFQIGQKDEAITHLRQALQIDPNDGKRENNLGFALFQIGQKDEAITHLRQALQINPHDAKRENNLGFALSQMGQQDEAIIHFQRVLQISPDDANARGILGRALLQAGREGEAIVQFQKALQINPRQPEIQNTLAWMLATAPLATLRDGRRAVELAEQANQTASGENPLFLRTLAAAYAEAGRFDDAVRIAQRAGELAQTAGQSGLVEQLNSELKFYLVKLPFHRDGK
jgi:tetratricopeptide (TPR) repeat protein